MIWNIQGNCTAAALGCAQVGLIYVDTEGYLGNPDSAETAPHVGQVFGRMSISDSGGCFSNDTSGIEGQWTTYSFQRKIKQMDIQC